MAWLDLSGLTGAMPESLESLPSIPELYDYRAGDDGVPLWLPYNQGDVFDNIDVPELLNHTGMVMLFMHPCTMRDTQGLREFVTIVSVREETATKVIGSTFWEKRYKVMPLPDLRCDGCSTHFGDFMSINTIRSNAIPRDKRTAQLSLTGRLHFLQRFHLTRFAPRISELEDATRAVERELQQQADWLESANKTTVLDIEGIEKVEREFQTYLDAIWDERQGEPPRAENTLREGLRAQDSSHAVRRIQRDIASGRPGQSLGTE